MNEDIIRRKKEILEKEIQLAIEIEDATLVRQLKEAPTMDAEIFKEMEIQTEHLEGIRNNTKFFSWVIAIGFCIGIIMGIVVASS